MEKVLHLNLKKKWFDMIQSGGKKEEYREVTTYWAQRFLCAVRPFEWRVWQEIIESMKDPYFGFEDLMSYYGVEYRGFEVICFRNGYRPDARSFQVEITSFDIKCGRVEWGAEMERFYFVFALGKVTGR
ncbi:MAG: hypothetical protein Q8P24_02065 [Desulfobacterales bacterium]|nr:hypothetical protein [Desulfobacterales bacterium]MDZ4341695.1 hypothetical protein [Candidatus Binatia bacterium]